jgi:GT2 family glycosyltransferase
VSSPDERPRDVSLVVTTYGGETYHTQHCLGRLRRWKTPRTELIVVVHDETPLLRAFLELCRELELIDRLLRAETGHGHVRGVNLGFAHATAEVVFNVCVDMRVGGVVVADCARLLAEEPRAGLVGWHYDWTSPELEGTRWRGGRLEYTRRGALAAEHERNLRGAPWATGRALDALAGVHPVLCNGSFFGIRRALWERLGGFDEQHCPVHWADDYLGYAVLDQGLDVLNVPRRYRCAADPAEFQALSDLVWQRRRDPFRGRDQIDWSCRAPDPRLSARENVYLDVLGRSLPRDAAVLVVGDVPWTPPAAARLQRRPGGTAADALPRADLLLCGAGALEPGLCARVRPGGRLIAFGGAAPLPGAARVDALQVWDAPMARLAFRRPDPARPAGARRRAQRRGCEEGAACCD